MLCRSANEAFVDISSPGLVEAAETGCLAAGYNTSLLSTGCPLTARKFPKPLAERASYIFAQCGFEMKVVSKGYGNDGICERVIAGERQEIPVVA